MMKISPVNNHVLIEPLKREDFIATSREVFSEIGVVIDFDGNLTDSQVIHIGDKVFFDSWLAAKFPKEGTTDEFYWLIKWEDVRAVAYDEQPISK